MNETWKDIPEYEGCYQISDLGRVLSVARVTSDGKNIKERFLTPRAQASGHLGVCLCRRGIPKQFRVHCLVLLAFIGPRPSGMEVRHLDGDPSNNQIWNLAYGTHSENARDTYAHGARRTGEGSHLAKISDAQAKKLLSLKGKVSSYAAAREFGLSDGYVRRLWRGESRRHAGT